MNNQKLGLDVMYVHVWLLWSVVKWYYTIGTSSQKWQVTEVFIEQADKHQLAGMYMDFHVEVYLALVLELLMHAGAYY